MAPDDSSSPPPSNPPPTIDVQDVSTNEDTASPISPSGDTASPLTRVDASSDEDHSPFPAGSALARLLGIQGRGTSALSDEPEYAFLHPHVRALTPADLGSCVAMEEAGFPPQERCPKETILYRLTKCGELCLGIFSTAPADSKLLSAATASAATPADSAEPDSREVLVASIIATKLSAPKVTDGSMARPSNWSPHSSSLPKAKAEVNEAGEPIGHEEQGRTLALHSVCVLPEYRGIGLGRVLMKAYLERMEDAGLADRVAILAHKELVGWYGSLGFRNEGESKAQFGGGGWTDLIYPFASWDQRRK